MVLTTVASMKTFAIGQFESATTGPDARPPVTIDGANLTLLIVEDDPNLLRTLTYSLTRAGFRLPHPTEKLDSRMPTSWAISLTSSSLM